MTWVASDAGEACCSPKIQLWSNAQQVSLGVVNEHHKPFLTKSMICYRRSVNACNCKCTVHIRRTGSDALATPIDYRS